MFGFRVHDGRELAVIFEHGNALPANPVNCRTGAKGSSANCKEFGFEKPANAPVETVAGTLPSPKSHQLEQLNVADELRVAHLPQQGDVAFRLHDHAVFRVSHNQQCLQPMAPSSTSSSRACSGIDPVLS